MSPKERRMEMLETKHHLEKYQSYKQDQIFFGMRDRSVKGGWRHGITGVEDSDTDANSLFFSEAQRAKSYTKDQKD